MCLYFKNQFLEIQQRNIGIQTRLFPISIQIRLDLLTNIQWGSVFSIDNLPQRYRLVYDFESGKYNGTYWGVVEIEHTVDSKNATTKLRGEMFNIK